MAPTTSDNHVQRYLLKSEPSDYSIQQLQQDHRAEWDGVRNYAARKHLQAMRPGDQCFFYHSSCKVPSIVGTCRITRSAQPDPTAVDPKHKGYDSKSMPPDENRWVSVEVEFEELYETTIAIQELRAQATVNPTIADLMLLKQSRLSVMPITNEQWQAILTLQEQKEKGQDLLLVDDSGGSSKKSTSISNAKRNGERKKKPKKRKLADSSTSTTAAYSDNVNDPNYCSNPELALSPSHIQAIRRDTATKISEKDLGLKGRKHLYLLDNGNVGTDFVVYYDGTKFIGKDLERMNTLVSAAKEQEGNDGNVYLLLSATAGICKRKTLPSLLSGGATVQRVPG